MKITVQLEGLISHLTEAIRALREHGGIRAAGVPARYRSARWAGSERIGGITRIVTVVLAWAALTFTAMAGAAASEATPSLAKHLPPETTAFISTPDFQALDERLQTTFAGKMADAPQMAKFVEQFQRPPSDSPDAVPRLGVSWSDLREIATGSVALAVAGAGEQDMGFVLLVEIAGRDDQVQAMFDRINQSLEKAGVTRTKFQIEGQQVEAMEIPGAQSNDPTVTRVVFKTDSLLAISDRRSLIEGILARLEGRLPTSLAQQESFAAVAQASLPAVAGRRADVNWFVAPWRHVDLLVDAGKAERSEELAHWRSQGFDAIQAVGGSVLIAQEDRDFEATTVIHAPGPRRSTAEALSFRALAQISAPSWLPADAATFTAAGWDLAAAFRAYGHWFDETYADGEPGVFDDVLLDILEEEGGPQVDVRKELIEELRNPVTIVTAPVETQEIPLNRTVFSVSTADAQRVAQAVRRMLEGDQDVNSVTIENQQAWVFREMQGKDEESAADMALGPDLSGLAICVAQQRVWTATDLALLTKILSADKTSSEKPALLTEVTEIVQREAKGEAVAWQYSNLQQRLLSPYEQLRTRNMLEEFSLLGLFMAAVFPDGVKSDAAETPGSAGIDWALLPPFDEIRTFLPPAGAWIKQTRDGWLLWGFTLSPGPAK